ncbi:MAG: PAAR domain-containing protein [Cellvibrionaceae bacterium]
MGSKSKQPAARLGDIDTGHPPSPPTPIITGSTNVLINGRLAARKGDMLVPHHPGVRIITEGSGSVLINGKPAARVSDGINCGGKIIIGSGNVLIGDKPKQPANSKLSVEVEEFLASRSKGQSSKISNRFESTELAASIAVKYRGNEGAIATWHEYYLGNDPENASELSDPIKKKGHQRAQAEKARDKADLAQMQEQPAELEALSDLLREQTKELNTDDLSSDTMNSIAQDMVSMVGTVATATSKSDVAIAALQQSISEKRVDPKTFKDATDLLNESRKKIAASGSRPDDKYTQDELQQIAAEGEIPDHYIVRVVKSAYLHSGAEENFGGTLGQEVDGVVKYWSTTLDQIAHYDTDPRLVVQAVGIDYEPTEAYTMIIIDKNEVANKTGSYAMLPNYGNMNNFSKRELAENFPVKNRVDATLTPETSDMYLEAYTAMESVKKGGSKDKKIQNKYFEANDFSEADKQLFKNRLALHKATGANEHYLGNGLTKNLNDSDGSKPHGTVETFSYDKNPDTIAELMNKSNPTVAIVPLTNIPDVNL